jgi:hypothetical protein
MLTLLVWSEPSFSSICISHVGAKLRSSDLALAQITAKWRGALKTFQSFQSECAKAGFASRRDSTPCAKIKHLTNYLTKSPPGAQRP